MKISKLYELLTIEEKSELYNLIKQERLSNTFSMNVYDWCDTVNMSVRLYNILMSKFQNKPDKLVFDITQQEFFSIRHAGKKTWDEFILLRGE